MSPRSALPKSRHHVMLYDEDWDFLLANYGRGGAKPIGASAAITAIVHTKIRELRALAAETAERERERERTGE